jgi:hypothetical protein
MRRAISRARAVCHVEFLANSQLLAATSALHPIPIRLPHIRKDLFSASLKIFVTHLALAVETFGKWLRTIGFF